MVPNTPSNNLTLSQSIRLGLGELLATLRTLPREKNLMLYLIAHLIYIDGLNTLFAFAGIYAAGTFHMKLPEVILFGLTMNISAGIGATLFAWGDDYFGSKSTILMALFCLVLLGSAILWIEDVRWFWACGLLLTLFVGPVQAASRSLMARLTTPQKSSEWFGLFASSGKITSFIGPWLVGYVTLLFGSQRAGMATVILFFLAGGIFMCFIREPKKNVSIV